jgi:hypothetical protein
MRESSSNYSPPFRCRVCAVLQRAAVDMLVTQAGGGWFRLRVFARSRAAASLRGTTVSEELRGRPSSGR